MAQRQPVQVEVPKLTRQARAAAMRIAAQDSRKRTDEIRGADAFLGTAFGAEGTEIRVQSADFADRND